MAARIFPKYVPVNAERSASLQSPQPRAQRLFALHRRVCEFVLDRLLGDQPWRPDPRVLLLPGGRRREPSARTRVTLLPRVGVTERKEQADGGGAGPGPGGCSGRGLTAPLRFGETRRVGTTRLSREALVAGHLTLQAPGHRRASVTHPTGGEPGGPGSPLPAPLLCRGAGGKGVRSPVIQVLICMLLFGVKKEKKRLL